MVLGKKRRSVSKIGSGCVAQMVVQLLSKCKLPPPKKPVFLFFGGVICPLFEASLYKNENRIFINTKKSM